MTLLVLSDSHGDAEAVRRAVLACPRADTLVHLGDGARDAALVFGGFPEKSAHILRGNCDFWDEPPLCELLPTTAGRIYLTHGWAEHVKSEFTSLAYAAAERGASAALFGHTHSPLIETCNGILLMNPGALSGRHPTYGVLNIESGKMTPAIFSL